MEIKKASPGKSKGFWWIFAAVLGTVFSLLTARLLGGFFTLAGVFFVIFAIMKAVYEFQNAPKSAPEEKGGGREGAPKVENPLLCPSCGKPIGAEDAFCRACGTKLT